MRGDRTVRIGGREIGPGRPCYLVAEISGNHNGRYERAVEIIRAAKAAGADAVKLQTYTPDTLTIACDREWFRVGEGSLWAGKTLYELYREAQTPWAWHAGLFEAAREAGLDVFSTPFDASAVAFLESLDTPCYKVASFELVDPALLRVIGETGKPVIVSTGMATLGEIEEAVRTLREAGSGEIVLLKCTSAYPAEPREMNLRTLPHLAEAFGVVVGLSDHTLGTAVPVAGVAMGASVIEKHLTLSRSDPGPDSAFSLEPEEFKAMAEAVRAAEQALGEVSYEPTEGERAGRIFRRSLFVVSDVKKGEVFTPENVRSIRPGYGLPPKDLCRVLGRRAACDIARGTPLAWDLVG